MKSRFEINKRIIKEIDNLDAADNVKEFLKEILECELDNLDKGKPEYTEKYKEIFNSISP